MLATKARKIVTLFLRDDPRLVHAGILAHHTLPAIAMPMHPNNTSDGGSLLAHDRAERYDEQKSIDLHMELIVKDEATPAALSPLESAITVVKPLSERLYTVAELMRLSELTRKQINYWEQIGLVTPALRTPRISRAKPCVFYSASEVLKALVICDLLQQRLSLQQVQQLACNLRELDVDLYDKETYLLTDGYSLYYAFSDGQVVDVHKHHRQMLLLVPIHEQVAKLLEAA